MPLPSGSLLIGTPFIELSAVDSTNNYALAKIHANLSQPGTCYFAHEQTSGKGQRGKSWATERGLNIMLSIVLKPDFLKPFQQFQLSASVAVATHRFFNSLASEPLKIKWPNDLYWGDQKLGGILIENIITTTPGGGNWDWAVVGIGINVNQTNFAADLKNPVSLKQMTNKSFDQVALAKGLCTSIDHFYRMLMTKQANAILEMYNQDLYKKDEVVKLKKSNRIFPAIIKEVTPTGQLVVQHSIEERFNFGEIEWVI